MNEPNKADTKTPTDQHPPKEKRRTYATPRLVRYGSIQDMTTGGSPGGGDSGDITLKQPI